MKWEKIKKNIFVNFVKVIITILTIETVIIFALFNWVWKYEYDFFNVKVYAVLIIILNLILCPLFLGVKKLNNNIVAVIILLYFIIAGLIPVYHVYRTEAPTGPLRNLAGIAVIRNDRNIYWIDIRELYN